jgi:hypothetical protein
MPCNFQTRLRAVGVRDPTESPSGPMTKLGAGRPKTELGAGRPKAKLGAGCCDPKGTPNGTGLSQLIAAAADLALGLAGCSWLVLITSTPRSHLGLDLASASFQRVNRLLD